MMKFQKTIVYLTFLSMLFLACPPVFAAAKVNINTATVEQLADLQGIGVKTAQKIVDYRHKHKFETIDDLLNVKGVGQKKFDQIKDRLTVAGEKQE